VKIQELSINIQLRERLNELGYDELWPPQAEAIKAGLLDGQNLLVTTPTASGKTLIGILIIGKKLLEDGGKAVYIVPLRALANEKYDELRSVFENIPNSRSSGIKVMITTGDYDESDEYLSESDIIIMTNEKYDSLMRHHTRWLKDVTVFVFDEVHLLNDQSRGGTLEFIMNMTLNNGLNAQILALSATITNAKEIAKWIGGRVVDVQWRPVPLKEGIATSDRIYYADGSVKEIVRRGTLMQDLVDVCLAEGGQALIFAETRKKAIVLAESLVDVAKKYVDNSGDYKADLNKLITDEETTLTRTLRTIMNWGVAFHHAGLPSNYREAVETLFRNNKIKVLTATPTLAIGVNMPARTVIINSLFRYGDNGMEPIKIFEYKQMAGRAGRPKYDAYGQSIIVSNSNVNGVFDSYIRGELEPIESKLSASSLLSYILAYLTIIGPLEPYRLKGFFLKSLISLQRNDIGAWIDDGLGQLVKEQMIHQYKNGKYAPTPFGRRVSELYISPKTARLFINHLPNLMKEIDITLPIAMLIAASPDIQPALQGAAAKFDEVIASNSTLIDYIDEDPFTRSFLGIYGWINEYSDQQMIDMYRLEPGDVYRLIESARWICNSFLQLSRLAGARSIDFTSAVIRIDKGVKRELIPLAQIEGIGRKRARAMYAIGIRDPLALINTPVADLAKISGMGEKVAMQLIGNTRKFIGIHKNERY
jgi:helicase